MNSSADAAVEAAPSNILSFSQLRRVNQPTVGLQFYNIEKRNRRIEEHYFEYADNGIIHVKRSETAVG
jgi:hypothetical protein